MTTDADFVTADETASDEFVRAGRTPRAFVDKVSKTFRGLSTVNVSWVRAVVVEIVWPTASRSRLLPCEGLEPREGLEMTCRLAGCRRRWRFVLVGFYCMLQPASTIMLVSLPLSTLQTNLFDSGVYLRRYVVQERIVWATVEEAEEDRDSAAQAVAQKTLNMEK